MTLCEYADLFGVPGQGIHAIRIGNIAIVDVIFTVIGAYLLSKFFDTDFIVTLIAVFLLGIILHHMFCVETTINKWLFG